MDPGKTPEVISGSVFTVYMKSEGADLRITLNDEYHSLVDDNQEATGLEFWKEVEGLVSKAVWGEKSLEWGEGCVSVRRDYCTKVFVYDFSYSDTLLQCARRVDSYLEDQARNRWLRPGLPPLHTMVKKFLKRTRENVLVSLIEHQHRCGYASTLLLLEQYKDDLCSCEAQSDSMFIEYL